MTAFRYWRWVALAMLLITLTGVIIICEHFNNNSNVCLGIPVKEEEILSSLQTVDYDYSKNLYFNDELCAIDKTTKTIYISQSIDTSTSKKSLTGKLRIDINGYYLNFIDNGAFDNIAFTVSEGKSFRLAIINPLKQYTEYTVVFTTLPVISLNGEETHIDEENRKISTGELCIWDPSDPDTGRYSVKTSSLEWHVRGNSSALFKKKPYKLSLKDKDNENKNLSMLGLGEDDDWILNPMNADDTYLREALLTQLWNSHLATEDYNYKMSAGGYVEVIKNGEYFGLYTLQRRIDKKYLSLEENDILFKGSNLLVSDDPTDLYEIVYSPYDDERTYSIAQEIGLFDQNAPYSPENIADIQIFVSFASALDNLKNKNMFFLFKADGDSYRVYLIPWDMDLSFGLHYDMGIEYNYEFCLNVDSTRNEFYTVSAQNSSFYKETALRWQELRKTALTEETIFGYIESSNLELSQSGAVIRNTNKWGLLHDGENTIEGLRRFISDKLKNLDAYYAKFIK